MLYSIKWTLGTSLDYSMAYSILNCDVHGALHFDVNVRDIESVAVDQLSCFIRDHWKDEERGHRQLTDR